MTEIRELKPEEIRIYLRLLSELDEKKRMPEEEARALFHEIRRYPYYKIYCVCPEDKMIGTYTLIILDNFGHGGLKIAIVENVAVAPDARHAGIGRKMMDDAMQRAKDNGCYKLMLSSDIKRSGAHAFYDSLGFQRHGISFRTELNK
ncbi:GNAT family N-acetyltransferase [Sporolactobacillus sp. CQH2019]|uniref:GNAT family N-acetyltransferase n=1 Tax=Sporolactobacillus sp. CQH2019 TaxID=3023512 RepID=UPI0023679B8F|nr:GNAT family N-acetyltransferase [Sporolactobacillus sp. CQH2019]MDD9150016.1 GNAT family N-acetyltransferase [Sporolactobacillus sp. CQH2019]